MSATVDYLTKVEAGAYGSDRLFLAEQLRRLLPMDLDEWAFWEYLRRTNPLPKKEAAEFFTPPIVRARDAVLAGEAFMRSAGVNVERERYLAASPPSLLSEREQSWDGSLRADYEAEAMMEKAVRKLEERAGRGQPIYSI
jgi:hypothetical protein